MNQQKTPTVRAMRRCADAGNVARLVAIGGVIVFVLASTVGAVQSGSRARPEASSTAAVPATYQQACASEGSVCLAGTRGLIPRSLYRSLHFPTMHRGESCPASPGSFVRLPYNSGVVIGSGPARPRLFAGGDLSAGTALLSRGTAEPGWLGYKTMWFVFPSYHGPVVVRARRLDGPGQIEFDVGGPNITTLVIPPGPTLNENRGWRYALGGTYVKSPGCYAWQVDGLNFSDVIVVHAVL